MRKTPLATLAAIAVLAGGCAGRGEPVREPPREQSRADVDVVNIAFAPTSLEVDRGTTVVWTNQDQGVRHTVTSGLPGDVGVPGVTEPEPPHPDGLFDGNLEDAEAEFRHTFTRAGAYEYFCRVHPAMTGEVIVR
ncbi:MAG TPA: plastocyanin/azurin family copper-binding protein [Actinomycetota bacterium]|nr:plastocyanin/azurin family copper-binding protein [Actinomycetota bacterium]